MCGSMTSGGTESILTAVKASRDYMCQRRGIKHPEMIIAQSGHAAFFKAAEYFKIRLIKACAWPGASGRIHLSSCAALFQAVAYCNLRLFTLVGKNFRLPPAAVRQAIVHDAVLAHRLPL